MMSGRISEKPQTKTNKIIPRTDKIIGNLKTLADGWGGALTKKPTAKAVRRLKKVLETIETSHMPFPVVTAVGNGGMVLTWTSLTRDIMMTVDPDGDIQFVTALKKLDAMTGDLIDRLDSEGAVTDMKTIDHMMAWYCMDKAHAA